jgi:ComF family protein
MAARLPQDKPMLLVVAPTATSRVRARGYDQSVLLTKHLSRLTKLPHASLLVRMGQQRQLGQSKTQRRTQLAGSFRVRNPLLCKDRHCLLIDDVVTTGSTIEAAAQALMDAGARRVDAFIFAAA